MHSQPPHVICSHALGNTLKGDRNSSIISHRPSPVKILVNCHRITITNHYTNSYKHCWMSVGSGCMLHVVIACCRSLNSLQEHVLVFVPGHFDRSRLGKRRARGRAAARRWRALTRGARAQLFSELLFVPNIIFRSFAHML
ncbi:hypothetical protein EVAR_65119_1 [Eumeta japonica]|uniref:Uncharacterized protein n=1 Tax=Eumeta variegata TaxID=151549 RepID=A0A4C1Z8L7_EUMVA|nr:hypothetical protein EVAR_65119_1 [Eumeta japonica]